MEKILYMQRISSYLNRLTAKENQKNNDTELISNPIGKDIKNLKDVEFMSWFSEERVL